MQGYSLSSFGLVLKPLASAPKCRSPQPLATSCGPPRARVSQQSQASWASAIEEGYIVNLPGAWGMCVPMCACIYGGALELVSRVRMRASCVGACVGMGGGAGLSRCSCVGGGLVCLSTRAGMCWGGRTCVYCLTRCWILLIWLGTVSRCQAFYSY